MPSAYLGVDIGGTKIFTGSFSENYHLLEQDQRLTNAHAGQEQVLRNICDSIRKLKTESTKSIGVALAGFVDAKNGVVGHLPNIPGFDFFPIAEYLRKQFNIPVFIENDARLFAFSEQKTDTNDPKVLLGIILGTGVGSGIIIDGQIYHGANNYAGEIGHTLLYGQQKIEVETLFSGRGVRNAFQAVMEISEELYVDQCYIQNRIKLKPTVDSLLDLFSVWIYNLILTFDPTKIVFGGGVGKNFWVLFEEEIRAKTEQLFRQKKYPMSCDIAFSQMPNSGATGAAILAREKLWETESEFNFKK